MAQIEGIEVRHLRVWWHCGWAVTADPVLDGEACDDGRTLRLFDEEREFSLTSNLFARNDGVPFRAEDGFGWFPPTDPVGQRFAHEDADHVGRAVWVAVAGDGPTRTSLLVAITLHRASQRGAQMTTVVHGGDPMLEAQGEPERSSACNRANPGRKERRGDSTEWDNATPPLSGCQSLS